jgi:predicted flap endonuclease-1-like 5' DNA nuclease
MCTTLGIASQIILCLLLAALLGVLIGYLLGKRNCKETSTETTSIVDNNQNHVSDHDKPETLQAPREGQKDNLKRIKGIGPKIEETLNAQGIFHFDQIANWNEKNIAWVDDNVAFPGRVQREEWVSQAKKLASGEETEFSKRVDSGEVSSSKKS